jgi:hypothetical protein
VLETSVVTREDPFHCTMAPRTKLAPLTVRVKAEAPGATLTGARLEICGTG